MLLFGWLNSFRYNYTLHTQQTRPFFPPIFESDLHRRYSEGVVGSFFRRTHVKYRDNF